jgi:uncharacterized protein YyaL (SSP411 family)
MTDAANLLGQQTSPYLLQHAENPVHWRPWGQAALAEAAAADKPILLSIGYAACHWCHVMAHESFEDPDTAALMNTLFVNIKVDREERPDIDHLYMSALHGLGEQGGWPLTMFLAPDGAPFWGGTYFPPTPRWGRPSFRQVLQGVAAAWHERDTMVTQNTAALRRMLERQSAVQGGELPTQTHLDAVNAALLRITDPDQGGIRVRRNSLTRRSSAFCGRTPSAPVRLPGRTRCICCWNECRKAASTTISAAATRATPPMRFGWCRISRRCCTTMRRSSSYWHSRTRTGLIRSMPRAPPRPSAG